VTQADFFIADIPIHGRLILAPMDGISDAAFRLLTRRLGSAYSVSEFINTLDYAHQKTIKRSASSRVTKNVPSRHSCLITTRSAWRSAPPASRKNSIPT